MRYPSISCMACSSIIYENLCFGKNFKLSFTVWSCPLVSTAVVEPFTTVLCAHFLLEHTVVTIMYDNEALYDTRRRNLDFDTVRYRLFLLFFSPLTASLRCDGALNVDTTEFLANLVPYPRILFLLSSYVPFISAKMAHHEQLSVAASP